MFVIPQLVSIEGCSLILFCGVPHKDACMLSDEQARQTFSFCFPELLFHNKELLVGHWGQSLEVNPESWTQLKGSNEKGI